VETPWSDRGCQILRSLALFQPKGAGSRDQTRVRSHRAIAGEAFATKNRVITGQFRQRETARLTKVKLTESDEAAG
jgi:hypothetical protein